MCGRNVPVCTGHGCKCVGTYFERTEPPPALLWPGAMVYFLLVCGEGTDLEGANGEQQQESQSKELRWAEYEHREPQTGKNSLTRLAGSVPKLCSSLAVPEQLTLPSWLHGPRHHVF